jgi:hypothetical protein
MRPPSGRRRVRDESGHRVEPDDERDRAIADRATAGGAMALQADGSILA